MKSGQAAMEFLMTYGWALLIVLVAIAVLAAMGVFQGKLGYEACIAGTGLSCKDFKVQRLIQLAPPDEFGRIEIEFLNGFGRDVYEFFVTIDPGGKYCPGITGVVASTTLNGRGFLWLPSVFNADQTLPLTRSTGLTGIDCNNNPANCCLAFNLALGPTPLPDPDIQVPCVTSASCVGAVGSPERLPNSGTRVKLDFFMTYRFGDPSSLLHSRKGYLATTVESP